MAVGEVQLQLEELFTRLAIKDDMTKRRYLVKALNKDLAYEVERSRTTTFIDTIKEAKRVEALTNKYKGEQSGRKSPTYLTATSADSVAYDRSVSTSSTMDRLAEDFTNALKIHMAKLQPGIPPQHGYDGRDQVARQENDGPRKPFHFELTSVVALHIGLLWFRIIELFIRLD